MLAAVQFSLTGLTVFGAIYVQNVLGFSPIGAGLSLLPLTFPLLVLAPIAGRVYDRAGPRLLVGGGVLLAGIGLMWDAAVLDEQDYALLVPGYLLMGVGLALVMSPASTDVMNAAPAAPGRGLRGDADHAPGRRDGWPGDDGDDRGHHPERQDRELPREPGRVARPGRAARAHPVRGGRRPVSRHLADLPDVLNTAQDALVSGIGTAYWVGGAVMVASALAALLLLRRVEAVDAPTVDPKPLHPAHAPVAHASSAGSRRP